MMLWPVWIGKDGLPVERFRARRLVNLIRVLLHADVVKTWKFWRDI